MNIFVTGACSGLARALLPRLCEDPGIGSVCGLDLQANPWRNAKYRHIQGDMCIRDLRADMHRSDAVIHLAFAVQRAHHTDRSYCHNNVQGSIKVFESAKALGIHKVINLSSVSVYGSGTNLSESAPLQPAPVFRYAQNKADIERMAVDGFPNVVHLRSHLIFGPNAQPFLHDMCTSPVYIRPPKPYPKVQVVHEADVAQAIMLCLRQEAHGAYNLAAPTTVSLPDLVKHQRSKVFPLPLWLVRSAAHLAQRLGHRDEFTWLGMMDTSLTVDCARVERELGWRPQYSAWQARESMVTGSTAVANPQPKQRT